jgi:hypothetical protein
MCKLHATFPLLVVWGQPSAQGMSSTPTDMLQLPAGQRRNTENYRACRHAKEMWKRKSQKTTNTMTGRKFSSKFTTSTISFAVALRGNSEHKKRSNLHPDSVAGLIGHETSKNEQRQERGQSGRDPHVNSLSSDGILKASFVVQQIMAEFKMQSQNNLE